MGVDVGSLRTVEERERSADPRGGFGGVVRIEVVATPVAHRLVVGLKSDVLDDGAQPVDLAFQSVGLDDVGNGRFRAKVVEAEALVGHQDEIEATILEQIGDVDEVLHQIGLVLDGVGRADSTELAVDDAQIARRRDVVDVGDFSGAARVVANLVDETGPIENVEIGDTLAANHRSIEGADLEDRSVGREEVEEFCAHRRGRRLPAGGASMALPAAAYHRLGEQAEPGMTAAVEADVEFGRKQGRFVRVGHARSSQGGGPTSAPTANGATLRRRLFRWGRCGLPPTMR